MSSSLVNGVDDTPLEQDEIKEAKERIEELHPLSYLPLSKVFPMWAPLIRCCSKGRKAKTVSKSDKQMEEARRLGVAAKSLGVSFETAQPLLNNEEEPQEDEDPYLMLGFGMVAYFTMLRTLIMMFSFFTLMMIPTIFVYSSYNGLESGTNYAKTKFSLGNLGFSEHICKHQFLSIDGVQELSCRTGTID